MPSDLERFEERLRRLRPEGPPADLRGRVLARAALPPVRAWAHGGLARAAAVLVFLAAAFFVNRGLDRPRGPSYTPPEPEIPAEAKALGYPRLFMFAGRPAPAGMDREGPSSPRAWMKEVLGS